MEQEPEVEYCASVDETIDDVYAFQLIVGMELDEITLCILVIISYGESRVAERKRKASGDECDEITRWTSCLVARSTFIVSKVRVCIEVSITNRNNVRS